VWFYAERPYPADEVAGAQDRLDFLRHQQLPELFLHVARRVHVSQLIESKRWSILCISLRLLQAGAALGWQGVPAAKSACSAGSLLGKTQESAVLVAQRQGHLGMKGGAVLCNGPPAFINCVKRAQARRSWLERRGVETGRRP